MKKLLLSLILFSITSFAQFNQNHKSLVKTTFKREFDKSIITQHLSSENSEDVIAALLAISHSEDHNFISEITSLDFTRYGKYISFALGQLRVNSVSEDYLLSKLTTPEHQEEVLTALGKCGAEKSFNYIKENAVQSGFINNRGFYLGLYNFLNNKHTLTDKEKINLVLKNASIKNKNLPSILFCLSRTGVDKINCESLIPLLKQVKDPETIVNIISVLRRSPFIPESINQFNYVPLEDWRVRNELVRLYSKINFTDQKELEKFFSFLNDENSNVTRETAGLIGSINFDKKLSDKFKKLCYKYLDKDLEINTVNALLVSFCKKYDHLTVELSDKYYSKIDKSTFFSLLSSYNKDDNKKFELLLEKNKNLTNSEFLAYSSALLSLQNKIDSEQFKSELFGLFDKNNPPAIYIAATGMDSLFIKNNSAKITSVTKPLFSKKINDPHFSEALSGILALAEKISNEYYQYCLEKLQSSELISNKNMAEKAKDFPLTKRNDELLFEKIWTNAFKYKSAKIVTNKGEFIVKFKPEFAPVSTGNFVMLAEEGYFNQVVFHRVVSNFVIQTGDPTGTGWGGPEHIICSEFSPLEYLKGAVGMASSGKDTEGSQWYVMHSHFPHLNRRYTNFGIVEEGLKTVNKIIKSDYIKRIELQK